MSWLSVLHLWIMIFIILFEVILCFVPWISLYKKKSSNLGMGFEGRGRGWGNMERWDNRRCVKNLYRTQCL